jgi:hypothetical protein
MRWNRFPRRPATPGIPGATASSSSAKEDRTQRLLRKPLTIIGGERGIDLGQVLNEISGQTGVPFVYQPGAIAAVPAEARRIRGTFENAPAQQILEAIAGATGLSYAIQDDKVQIRSGGAAAAQVREPNIGFIQLDNGLNVMVPMSQVPPDLREYIRYKTQKELNKIRKQMEEEGFKPTTQPAGE